MVLNTKKRRMLVEAASRLKAGVGPSDAPLAPIPIPSASAPAPTDLRLKGVVEATASKEENTCSGLVFKRKRGVDAVVPAQSGSEGRASSF